MNHKKILKSIGYDFGKSFDSKMYCSEIQWKDVFEIMDKVQSLNKYSIIDGIIESRQHNAKIEAKEVTRQFKADLKSLLIKYKAEINLEEQHPGISYERGLDDIVIDIDAVYDNDHNCLVEATEINLGRNVDSDSL